MSPPTATLSVWANDQCACVRIAGRATFASSVDFKALLSELLQRGCRCLSLELSECVLMDSTFLGVLAGFGLKLSGGDGNPSQRGIELYNPSPRITELLETMGVLHLFSTAKGPFIPPPESRLVDHAASNPSQKDLSRTCIEAHQALIDINPANAAKFKDVTQFLAESLKKAQPGSA